MLKLRTAFITVIVTIQLCFTLNAHGQKQRSVDANELSEVVYSLNNVLLDSYIFPEISAQIKPFTLAKLESGEYNDFKSGRELAEQLTKDIQEISRDLHLKVSFDPIGVKKLSETLSAEEQRAFEKAEIVNQHQENFGFKQVSVLEGNVGYIDLRKFEYPEQAAETLSSAMTFLQHTNSLIIDLRKNRGGSPSMVQLFISYFLNEEPILLNDIYKRKLGLTKQYWSLPSVPGNRRPNLDVYVLTSRGTFSAAEDFSYTLKHLNRATIIGESTGGGAHAGGKERLTERFLVWVPTSRTINPNTKSNWEGTGVQPHIEVDASDALDVAHIRALEKHIEGNIGVEKINKWYLEYIQASTSNHSLSIDLMKKYAGNYGIRKIILNSEKLYYQRNDGPLLELKPMNDKVFLVEGKSHFRIKFVVENGSVKAIQGLTDKGAVSQSARDV